MHILIVDDEEKMALSLQDFLSLDKIETTISGGVDEAIRLMGEYTFDAIVSDLRMPGKSGMELLRHIRDEGRSLPLIMISAHGDVRDAVAAMKDGAFDYLVKPFDPEELVLRIKKAVSERRSLDILAIGMRSAAERAGFIGESRAIIAVRKLIEKAAPSPTTILITGESGTGKEVVARSIHDSSRRDGPFVAVNVGALPETLLESELFGHEKGAFTGAENRRIGLFEAAQNGTLFLDEIGELPSHLQVKLLRAIQDKKVQRLGSSASIPVNVRLLAATNRDLEAEVRVGKFREDLYYRINVIRIHLPPLREREGDRGLLAGYFFSSLCRELGRKFEGISASALERIESYSFPGNVRELANLIERAIILAEGPALEARDFKFGMTVSASAPPDQGSAPRSLAETEREAILAGLVRNRFHRERT
ncbi:MAG: sigma-54 dependent transcriptional regulator, partial [Spirochaetota bacterium]